MACLPVEEPSSAPPSSAPPVQAVARRAPQWNWNPYADTPLPSLLTSGVVAEETMSIPALLEVYEQQVTALVKSHEDIMFVKRKVQEAMNELGFAAEEPAGATDKRKNEQAPYQLAEQNRELELLKQGLDIRLRQFDEDCQRASKLEWVLRRKLSTTEDNCKRVVQKVEPFQVQPTCEALKKVQDQDRLIKLLQHVLDQNLYHNYVFSEGLRQMRKECFADELQCWGAIQGDSSWFEGEEIRFEFKNTSQFVSSWMQLIRTHPKPEAVAPPPRADPRSLSFVSKMDEINQLASAVVKGGHKLTKFSRQRDLEDLKNQLSQLRQVLKGAAAAAGGVEKVILKDLTAQVDERIGHISHAVAPGAEGAEIIEAQEAAADGRTSNVDRVTEVVALEKFENGGVTRVTSCGEGRTLAESNGRHEALRAADPRRGRSKSVHRQGSSFISMSSGQMLSKIPPRTPLRPRRSHTSALNIESENAQSNTAASGKEVFEKRKQPFSPHASSRLLRREGSRTVPSPRQSFHDELPRSQPGTGEEAQSMAGASRKEALEERKPSFLPHVSRGHLLRGASRTVTSPQQSFSSHASPRLLRRGASRTVPSPRQSFHDELRRSQPGVGEGSQSIAAATGDEVLEQRKPSFSPHSSPRPLLRGASRTVPSPRQSFRDEPRRSEPGVGGTARRVMEDSLPSVRSDTGLSANRGKKKEETHKANASAPLNTTFSRAGSRTVSSPRRTLSRCSLTIRSSRASQAPMISRALSSAFLGG